MTNTGNGISRRGLLALGAAAGGVAAGSLLPPSVQAALASPPRPGGLRAIKHVVILVQENRSFDHCFGTLRGVRGFGDRTAIRLPDGDSVFAQPKPGGGNVLPFPVRNSASDQHENINYIASLDHSWPGGHHAWADGWFDAWIAAKSSATMAYYDRRDLPFHYELADTFTVCDAYYCSVLSSTSPNRNYLVSGYTGEEPDGRRAIDNGAYDEDNHSGYAWSTYAEHLETARVPWKTYQEWDNYQDDNLQFFAPFKTLARKALVAAGLGFRSMESFYGSLFGLSPADQDKALAKLDAGVATLSAVERSLFDRALRRVRPRQLGAAFAADVAAGTLPAVSYIVPSAADSEHPSASSPAASASITYQILDALASHRDVWESTALFITYDENDGYYDHLPPPVPPTSVTDEYVNGQPIGLGVRVPMIVVSPWTVGGFVCSETFDHTSIVQFLEAWTGVRTPEIRPWRRTVAGDLTGAFDFTRGARPQALPHPGPVPPFTHRWLPAPPQQQALPAQEEGTRPARPLPYQPDASAAPHGNDLVITLTNTGRRSAHFAIYPYAGEFAAPRHLDVARRTTEPVHVPGTRYDLVVTGPNGFRRDFAGTVSSPAQVLSEIDGDDRQLVLTLVNTGSAAVEFVLDSQAYLRTEPQRFTVKPGGRRTVRWSAAGAYGWYDLLITVVGDAAYRRRLAGHIENGRPSVSG